MMTVGLRDWCRIIYKVTQAAWTCYADYTTECKSPQDALEYNVRMAGEWASEDHMGLTFSISFYEAETMRFCFLGRGSAQQDEKNNECLG